jgi:peptidoglycan-associated lipoprotein
MKRSWYTLTAVAIVLLALLVSSTGCKKPSKVPTPAAATKAEPTASAAPPAAAPTISLKVSPTAIEKGQSATLTWTSANATGVLIDNGVGTVEASGSRNVRPSVSTTYSAKASGPGGTAVAEARVTVTAPAAVTPPPMPAIKDAEFFAANIKDAFFDYDQYTIREDAKAALTADARALSQRPNMRIAIQGHCDERGSEKYNLALGDRRAIAAKEFLVNQGVSSGRIETISFGEEQPFCEEHNEECWQENRRAHIVMR